MSTNSNSFILGINKMTGYNRYALYSTSLLVKSDNTVLAILHSHTSRKIIDPMLFVFQYQSRICVSKPS